MVWQNWGPGELPVAVDGFPKFPWSHLIPLFPQLDRKLSLALPCFGIEGLSAGLREIPWDGYEIAYAFDIDESLVPVLLHTHGPHANLHVGSRRGDFLACDIDELPRVDLIIAGPPCPPFSSIGPSRCPENDPRERVFRQVTKFIKSQGRKRCLGFIVEMVLGIAHRSREQSYYEVWLEDLQRSAPMFRIDTWLVNSKDYVPQHRPRLYTVGVLRELLGDAGIPPPMPLAIMRASLGDALHKGMPPVDENMLTPHQRNNLNMTKPLLRTRLLERSFQFPCTPTTGALGRFQPPIACFSVDRDFEKQFGQSMRWDDATPTLRTGNEMLWLLKFSETGDLLVSRCLHPVERLALQGFPPELALFMSKKTLLRVTGNSFTAPVVTAVFRQCLAAITLHRSPITGAITMSSSMQRPLDEVAAILDKQRRINELRETIAILDAELQLQERQFQTMARNAGLGFGLDSLLRHI